LILVDKYLYPLVLLVQGDFYFLKLYFNTRGQFSLTEPEKGAHLNGSVSDKEK